MTATMNGAKNGRPTLAGQIDRLDGILDGLAEALNESVADAVNKTVGEVVRDTVESAVREVLADPALIRAALSKHAPIAALNQPNENVQPARRTLRESLGSTLTWLVALAAGQTASAGKALKHGWTWALGALSSAWKFTLSAASSAALLAWSCKRACGLALFVGAGCGVLAYLAGPLAASALCGVCGAALTLAGSLLMPLWRLMLSSRD